MRMRKNSVTSRKGNREIVLFASAVNWNQGRQMIAGIKNRRTRYRVGGGKN